MTVSDLIGTIDGERKHSNLSSALRLFVLDQAQYGRDQRDVPSRAAPERASSGELAGATTR